MGRLNLRGRSSLYKLIGLLLIPMVVYAANRYDVVNISQSLGVGTNSTNAKAAIEISSTTKGFLNARQTTVQRNAIATPPEGLSLFDITSHYPSYYDGTNWLDNLSMQNRSSATGLLHSVSGVVSASSIALTSDVSGILPAANGGTGQNLASSTGVLQVAAGTVSAASVALASQVSGTLPIANGGTNNAALGVTAGSMYYSDGSKLVSMGTGVNGQVPVSAGATVAWGPGGGGSSGINLLTDYNPKAELAATTSWTNSGGGTFTTTNTAANVANGTNAFSFDASANADYVISTAVTVPAGLFGANCLLEFYYKGFDANITAQVYDGSLVIASQVLSVQTGYVKQQLNFVCPSSGTVAMKLLASANAAIGYFDEVHLGSATNIANLSQATFIGSAYIAATGSCTPARTNTALGAFSTAASCPGPTVTLNPGPGIIQTTDTDLPKFTVNNLGPGTYKVEITVRVTQPNAISTLAINDGTTTAGFAHITGSATTIGHPILLSGVFTYTSTANRTFEVYGAESSGAVTIDNSSGAASSGLEFRIYRFPVASELTINPGTSAISWTGYHDSTCSFARTNAAYGDPAADTTCTLTERTNTNMGTVTSYLSGSDKLPGIVFTPSRIGKYYVCAHVGVLGATQFADVAGKLWDGTTTIAETAYDVSDTTTHNNWDLCGIYSVTTVAAKTLSIQTKSSSGAVTIDPHTAASAIEWTIMAIDHQFPSPLIVNSVVSPSTGPERIVRATITNSGTPTVATQSGSWISSLTDNGGSGDTTINITAGTFSAAPTCTCSVIIAGTGICMLDGTTAPTTSLVRIQTTTTVPADSDMSFHIICMGPT